MTSLGGKRGIYWTRRYRRYRKGLCWKGSSDENLSMVGPPYGFAAVPPEAESHHSAHGHFSSASARPIGFDTATGVRRPHRCPLSTVRGELTTAPLAMESPCSNECDSAGCLGALARTLLAHLCSRTRPVPLTSTRQAPHPHNSKPEDEGKVSLRQGPSKIRRDPARGDWLPALRLRLAGSAGASSGPGRGAPGWV